MSSTSFIIKYLINCLKLLEVSFFSYVNLIIDLCQYWPMDIYCIFLIIINCYLICCQNYSGFGDWKVLLASLALFELLLALWICTVFFLLTPWQDNIIHSRVSWHFSYLIPERDDGTFYSRLLENDIWNCGLDIMVMRCHWF